jgi:hypothetical protein
VFDNEHSLHLWKRRPCTSTVWRQLTDWREQFTTWCDLRGLLYSHSDIVCLLIQSKFIELQPSICILIWVAWLFDHPVHTGGGLVVQYHLQTCRGSTRFLCGITSSSTTIERIAIKLGTNIIKKIRKSCPATSHEGVCRERRYSSYSFSTSDVDRSEWSASRRSRALPPGKGPPVPIVQNAGWAPEPVWTQRVQEKSSVGDRTPVLKSIVRHYTTDWATPAPTNIILSHWNSPSYSTANNTNTAVLRKF